MTDELAFLAAIRAQPDDDTARLVFADWLQKQGHDERAEFIRVQVRIAFELPQIEEPTFITTEWFHDAIGIIPAADD